MIKNEKTSMQHHPLRIIFQKIKTLSLRGLSHVYFRLKIFPPIKRVLKNKNSVVFLDVLATIGDPLQQFAVMNWYRLQHPNTIIYFFTSKKKKYISSFYSLPIHLLLYSNQKKLFIHSGYRTLLRFEYSPKYIERVFSDLWFAPTPIPLTTNTLDFLARKRLHFSSDWIPCFPLPPKENLSLIEKKNRGLILINKSSRSIACPEILNATIRAASFLQNSGFRILCNVSENESALPGTEPLHCSLPELYWFVKTKCVLTLSVRSGILDFLISTGCPIISIDDDPPAFDKLAPLSMWKTKTTYWEIPYSKCTNIFLLACIKKLKI